MEQKAKINTKKLFKVVAVLALIMLSGGAVFYHFVEGWSWIDSFYFCTVTLATVGYGDFTPTTDIAKIFTIFYILIGIGIIFAFASLLVRRAGERTRERIKKHNKEKK